MKVREFLKANNLKQRELAYFLGVTEAAISNVAKGKSYFSEENLIKILNNPHGWDVSMLTETQSRDEVARMAEQPKEQSTEAKLWTLVEEQRKDIQTLLELLKDRDREIKTLRAELESLKKGAA